MSYPVPPDAKVTLTFPRLEAGLLYRRDVRAAISASIVLGATVRHHEHKGLLDSVFAIRAEGTMHQLTPLYDLYKLIRAKEAE